MLASIFIAAMGKGCSCPLLVEGARGANMGLVRLPAQDELCPKALPNLMAKATSAPSVPPQP